MGRTIALVTGSSGFIGRHLVAQLIDCGMEVRRLVRGCTGSLPQGCICGDYATGAGLAEAVAGADIVFHLAGVTKALRGADYYSGNVSAAGNLARVAARVPRFVHVSSLAAVGPANSAEITEQSEPHPVSDYGRSKLAGELTVRSLLPNAVVVRPPVVYGPHDTDVFQMLRAIARGWDLRIGGGERWFSAIYVRDLVEGLLAAARSPGAAGKSYFLAHAEPVSWNAFSDTAARLLGCHPRHIVIPRPLAILAGWSAETWSRWRGRPGILSRDKVREAAWPRWTCATERAGRELGFTAPTTLLQGLARTLAWYKEQGWL